MNEVLNTEMNWYAKGLISLTSLKALKLFFVESGFSNSSFVLVEKWPGR